MKLKFLFVLLVVLLIPFWLERCETDTGEEEKEVPSYDVSFEIGVNFPENWMIGSYEISAEKIFLYAGNLTIYGAYLNGQEGFSIRDLFIKKAYAHAGHVHGEAELSGKIEGFKVLDLSDPAKTVPLGNFTLKEGHYFDGKISLKPMSEDVSNSPEELKNHSFYFEGTLSNGEDVKKVVIMSDVDVTIAGLEFAYNVIHNMKMVMLFDLYGLLEDIDFSTLSSDEDGTIVISADSNEEAYKKIKIKLKDHKVFVQKELLGE